MKKARPRNDIIVKTKFRFVGSLIYKFSLFNISLYVSTFARHYSCLAKVSVCWYTRTISLHCLVFLHCLVSVLVFLCTLVCSYGTSLVF